MTPRIVMAAVLTATLGGCAGMFTSPEEDCYNAGYAYGTAANAICAAEQRAQLQQSIQSFQTGLANIRREQAATYQQIQQGNALMFLSRP